MEYPDIKLEELHKRLSSSDKEAFDKCPRQYEFRALGAKRTKRPPPALIGKAVEEIAADGDNQKTIKKVELQLERRLQSLPEEEKKQHMESLQRLVETHKEMRKSDQSAANTSRNQLYSWKDPETGWVLFAKPDEIGTRVDDRGRRVLEISDDKISNRLTSKHRRQLYFFGLVMHKLREDREQLRQFPYLEATLKKVTSPAMVLVVRLLGAGSKVQLWFSRARVDEKLAEVRRVTGQIETFSHQGDFPAKPETGSCNHCPFNQICSSSLADITSYVEPEQMVAEPSRELIA